MGLKLCSLLLASGGLLLACGPASAEATVVEHTGDAIWTELDLRRPGVREMRLQRTYQHTMGRSGHFGANWGSLLDTRLEVEPDGGVRVTAFGGDSIANDLALPQYGSPSPACCAVARYAYAPPPMAPKELAEVVERLTRAAFDGRSPGPEEEASHRRRLLRDRAFRNAEWRRLQAHVPSRDLKPGAQLKRLTLRHDCDVWCCTRAYPELLVRTDSGYEERGPFRERVWYDEAGRLVGSSDSNGNADRLTWSDDRRAVAWADRFGHALRFTLDAAGRVSAVEDERQVRVTYRYNERDELIEVTHPTQGVSRYGYEDGGTHRLVAAQDRHGATRFEYEALGAGGRVSKCVDPNGVEFEWSYKDGPSEVAERDGSAVTIRRLVVDTKITRPHHTSDRRHVELLLRQEPGAPLWIVQRLSDDVLWVFNALGKLDAAGGDRYTYDPKGRLVRASTFFNTLTFTYAPDMPRVVRITHPAPGGAGKALWETLKHDDRGNVTAFEDSRGRLRHCEYDAEGRLVRLHMDRQQTLEVTYDNDCRPVRLRLAGIGLEPEEMRVSYDSDGKVVEVALPAAHRQASQDRFREALRELDAARNPGRMFQGAW
ncbi:MAG: DUF6531 domain-containing protein [Candidatus Sericytochromatia bacterium]|nr:DUF6531 domain-containing protein [Candidatus Sericytochromatia bacterium]